MMFKWLIFIACTCAIAFILFGILYEIGKECCDLLEDIAGVGMAFAMLPEIISGIMTFGYVAVKLGAMLFGG